MKKKKKVGKAPRDLGPVTRRMTAATTMSRPTTSPRRGAWPAGRAARAPAQGPAPRPRPPRLPRRPRNRRATHCRRCERVSSPRPAITYLYNLRVPL